MWLEENFQTNAVILSWLDTMTIEQKEQIDKFDEFVNPYQKALEANLNSVFISE